MFTRRIIATTLRPSHRSLLPLRFPQHRPLSFSRASSSLLELAEPQPPPWEALAAEALFRRSVELFRYCALSDAQHMVHHAQALLLQLREASVAIEVEAGESLVGLADVLRLKGVVLHASGRWREAKEVLEECLRLFPGDLLGAGDDAFVDICGVLNDLALTEIRLSEYEQAEKNLKRALYMAQRAYEPDRQLVALTKINLAEHAWVQGWYGAAAELLEKLLKDKPFKGKTEGICLQRTAHINFIKTLLSVGDIDRAESELSALELSLDDFDPSSTPYYGDIDFAMNKAASTCMLLSMQGDFVRAKEEADNALSFALNIAHSCENSTQHPDMLQMLQNSAIYSYSKEQARLKLELASKTDDLLVRSMVAENLGMLDLSMDNAPGYTELPIARRIHLNKKLSFHQILPYGGLIGAIFPEREDPTLFYERRSVGHKLEVNAS